MGTGFCSSTVANESSCGGKQSSAATPASPTCVLVQTIDIDHNRVTGVPLILEFQKIFLRSPIPPKLDDVFTAQDLTDWENLLWAATG